MLHVLHLTKTFLDENESWILNQLLDTPDVQLSIASARFLEPRRELPRSTLFWDPQGVGRSRGPALSLADRGVYSGFGKYLCDVAAEFRGDLVHVHCVDTAWLFEPLIERLQCPVVVSAYGVDLTALWRDNPVWGTRYETVAGHVACAIAQGPAGTKRIREWPRPPREIRELTLGVPDRQIALRPRVASEPITFLQMAHFREKKGHVTTLAAFAEAFGNSGKAKLLFVGDRPRSRDTGQLESLRTRVEAWQLQDVVEFHPAVSYKEITAMFARADVYVQPSCETASGDVEGGPLTIIEAQAHGLPVLSTLHENIPLLVSDGRSGWLVPERDHHALAEAMRRVAELAPSAFAQVSAAAIAKAATLTSARAGALLREIYDDVLRV